MGGRPPIDAELRVLIRRMSLENPLWGAPRIHGELLKLGFEVAQSSVAKYMVRRRAPPSQGWRPFLHNHAPEIAAMDLFVVPTITFKLLYGCDRAGSSQRAGLDQRHTTSDRGMGCGPDHRSIPVERSSAIHDPRPGSHRMVPSSHAGCAPWAFGTSPPHQPRPGRMALPNG